MKQNIALLLLLILRGDIMEEALPDRSLSEHLAGRYLGRMEPTPTLKYQKAA
jgi:hypothetical protein